MRETVCKLILLFLIILISNSSQSCRAQNTNYFDIGGWNLTCGCSANPDWRYNEAERILSSPYLVSPSNSSHICLEKKGPFTLTFNWIKSGMLNDLDSLQFEDITTGYTKCYNDEEHELSPEQYDVFDSRTHILKWTYTLVGIRSGHPSAGAKIRDLEVLGGTNESYSIYSPLNICNGSTGLYASVYPECHNCRYEWDVEGGTITSENNINNISWDAKSSDEILLRVTIFEGLRPIYIEKKLSISCIKLKSQNYNDCQSLQSLIDASVGKKIYFDDGECNCSLNIIQGPVSLEALNRRSVIFTGSGINTFITILNSNYVTVSGFQIKNYFDGIKLVNSSYCTLSGNRVNDFYGDAILLDKSSDNIINNNILSSQKDERNFGINLSNNSNSNNIADNEILVSSYEIVLDKSCQNELHSVGNGELKAYLSHDINFNGHHCENWLRCDYESDDYDCWSQLKDDGHAIELESAISCNILGDSS